MWGIIFLINFFVIFITHFFLCNSFKVALIISNIFWVILSYGYLFYYDGFIHWQIFCKVLLILSIFNFIISYSVGYKMIWFESKIFKQATPENDIEVLKNIVDIKGYEIKKDT